MSGGSQAVRVTAELRFNTDAVWSGAMAQEPEEYRQIRRLGSFEIFCDCGPLRTKRAPERRTCRSSRMQIVGRKLQRGSMRLSWTLIEHGFLVAGGTSSYQGTAVCPRHCRRIAARAKMACERTDSTMGTVIRRGACGSARYLRSNACSVPNGRVAAWCYAL